jgi:hypothetical protein
MGGLHDWSEAVTQHSCGRRRAANAMIAMNYAHPAWQWN